MNLSTTWKALGKEDTVFFKGLAILMIVLHNFMHLFPAPLQMEFHFSSGLFENMLAMLLSRPEEVVRIFFSYFGHFGVQVFFFLSAYGFTKKYRTTTVEALRFIKKRFLAIYPGWILAILVFVVLWQLRDMHDTGASGDLSSIFKILLFKVALVSNFIPGRELNLVGPWWFISVIFQFYFLFPFLQWMHRARGGVWMAVLAAGSLALVAATHGSVAGLNLYFTVLPYFPAFCLGMYVAGADDSGVRIHWMVPVCSFVLFVAGNLFETFWPLTHVCFLLLLLSGFRFLLERSRHGLIHRSIMFLGAISFPLFLVHGFLRTPLITWAMAYDRWWLTLVLCSVFVLLSAAVAFGVAKTEKGLGKLIGRS